MATQSESQLKLVISAVDEMSSTINAVNAKLAQMNETVNASNKASASAGLSFGKMTGGLALATVAATGLIALTKAIGNLAKEGIGLSGKLEQSQATIYQLGANTGWTKDKIDNLVGAIRSENKDIATSVDITKSAIQAGLTEAQALEIVSKARDVAAASNVSSNDAIRAMTISLTKLDPEMLRTYGMSLNLSDAYQEEADKLGKKTSELTTAEKKQAFYNEMMDVATRSQGAYTAAMDTWYKKANSVKDMMGDVSIIAGKLVSGAIKPIIDETYNAVKAFTQWGLEADGSLNPTLQKIADIIETVIMTVYSIGKAIITIIKDAFKPWVDRMVGTQDTMMVLAIATQIFGNYLVALIKTIGAVVVTISNLMSVYIDLKNLTRAIIKDGIESWQNYGSIIVDIFKALMAGLSGDFGKAKDILVNTIKKTFDDTSPALDKFKGSVSSASKNISKSWSDASNAWVTANDVNTESSDKAFNAFKLFSDLFNEKNKENTKSNQEEMNKMKDAYGKLVDSISKYAETAKSAYNDVSKSIDDLKNKIGELDNQNAESNREINVDFAEAYVKALDEAKKLKDEINKINNDILISLNSSDGSARNENDVRDKQAELSNLQQQLRKKEDAIARNATIATAYDDEIAEVRRKNNQDDLDRSVEALNEKRTKLEEDYEKKRVLMIGELKREEQKQAILKQIMENAQLELNLQLRNQEKDTIESINRQIDAWNELAKAISTAKAGQTSQKISTLKTTQEIAVITQQQKLQQPVNIYISGNTILDEKKLADTVLTQAMKELKNNTKTKQ
jgi:hypothetical protein